MLCRVIASDTAGLWAISSTTTQRSSLSSSRATASSTSRLSIAPSHEPLHRRALERRDHHPFELGPVQHPRGCPLDHPLLERALDDGVERIAAQHGVGRPLEHPMAHDLAGDLLDERSGERAAQGVPDERAVDHAVGDLRRRPRAEHGVHRRERGSLGLCPPNRTAPTTGRSATIAIAWGRRIPTIIDPARPEATAGGVCRDPPVDRPPAYDPARSVTKVRRINGELRQP